MDILDINEVNEASDRLRFCKKKIEEEKPKTSEVEVSVAGILVASNQTHWKRIKYYHGNMKNWVKEEFEKYQRRLDMVTLPVKGSRKTYGPPYDNVLGSYWHKLLSSNINSVKGFSEMTEDDELAKSLFQTLDEQFGIILLDCNFPLYGYMYKKEETASKVYLWQDAKADAIGYYFDKTEGRCKYVIVDWKVVDLLMFWTTPKTYGYYLHQSLVYARLLQLHLHLDYLPPILLVPISNNNGRDIQPGFFYDYPEHCKSAINDDCWSTTLPKPPLKIKGQWPLNVCNLKDGPVDTEMLLTDFFVKGAKVEDLIKAFSFQSIEIYDCKECKHAHRCSRKDLLTELDVIYPPLAPLHTAMSVPYHASPPLSSISPAFRTQNQQYYSHNPQQWNINPVHYPQQLAYYPQQGGSTQLLQGLL